MINNEEVNIAALKYKKLGTGFETILRLLEPIIKLLIAKYNRSYTDDLKQIASIAIVKAIGSCDEDRDFIPFWETIFYHDVLSELKNADKCHDEIEDNQLYEEISPELVSCISSLSKREKEIVFLRFKGYTYCEIGNKLDITEKAVDGILYRMRKRLGK
jgi:RNA polymerase sigma factor (sigma-70 family)